MKRSWLEHDDLVVGCIPCKRRRTGLHNLIIDRRRYARLKFDWGRLSVLLLKMFNSKTDPVKRKYCNNQSVSNGARSLSANANLWLEASQLVESSRSVLTPSQESPTVESLSGFRRESVLNLGSSEHVPADSLAKRFSSSENDLNTNCVRERLDRKNNTDENDMLDFESQHREDVGFTRQYVQEDKEIQPNMCTERASRAESLPADKSVKKQGDNSSTFTYVENDLTKRLGKLLLYFKESSELKGKSTGIFAECSIDLPDERTLFLRQLADNAFVELTEEQQADVLTVWMTSNNPHQVLVTLCSIPVTRADLRTLQGHNWLNDEIINFYMQLLVSRSNAQPFLPTVYAFNTFFFAKLQRTGHSGVCKWTKDVDIFSYDLLLVPIHLLNHWVLTVVDVRERSVKYYDSLGGSGRRCLQIIGDYLAAEMKDKKEIDMDLSMWTFQTADCPLQGNCSDCGLFVLKFAEFLCRDAPLTFNQKHMPSFRIRTAYEILHVKLL